jgi:integrase
LPGPRTVGAHLVHNGITERVQAMATEAKRRTGRKTKARRTRIGRVTLYAHHGGWWIYYREDGQPIRRRAGDELVEAERVAAEVNAQLTRAAPTLFSFKPIPVRQLVADFLADHEVVRRSSIATVNRYRTALEHLVAFAATDSSGRPAHQLNATRFVAFLRSRLVSSNGHANTRPRPLLDKGIRFILEVCRSLYGFAARRRHLPPYSDNPFESLAIDRMRLDDAKRVFVFDERTELAFLRGCRDWEFAVHATLAKTGMRPGELCHLLIEELDLDGGWIRVRNKPELGWSVKTRNERDIPLVDELRDLLRQLIGNRATGPVFLRPQFRGASSGGNRETLGSRLGKRIAESRDLVGREPTRAERAKLAARIWMDAGALDPDQVRQSFIRVANRVGLTGATCPKSWRHTFATLLQDANVDPLLRQVTLGHKPSGGGGALGMTAVYTHSRPATHASEICRALRVWPESLELIRQRLSFACADSAAAVETA